ncbi:MAG TPA: Uma2 family endonuclease [Bryobacteraceae bacterium]|jgi:Uma2 family endonuclease
MATLSKTVTYEEWLQMPITQDAIEEVVNGEIRIMPPNKSPHPELILALQIAFLPVLDHKNTLFISSTFGLVVRRMPLTCRNPDVAVFDRATVVIRDGYYHSAPQLIIEVLSPSETPKEIAEKLRDYESIGVPEVWLFDPEPETVAVLELRNGKLERVALLSEGILTPKHFPAVQIRISEIWPE